MADTDTDKARPSGSETRTKGGIIGFRVDAIERAEIESAAEAAGLTVGSYCRDTILSKALTTARRRPSLDRALLAQLLGQLGKLGGNMNQIAKRLNEGAGVGAERISSACGDFEILRAEILKAIRQLDHDNQGQVKASSGHVSNVHSPKAG